MTDLADRCEAAGGADRALSWDIWDAVGRPVVDEWSKAGSAPAYTTSLDAAMTLAEGKGGSLTFFKDGTAKCFLWQPYPLAIEAKAATPALALCAAALRAKEQTNG